LSDPADPVDPAADPVDPADVPLANALTAATAVYAEKGDLDEEARKPLLAAGISDEQIDFYIAGVKATEALQGSRGESRRRLLRGLREGRRVGR
jgi:hypothetical protein